MSDRVEDVIATPTSMLAEASLRQILAMAANGSDVDAICHEAELTISQIDMRRRLRTGRDRRRTWLAKVTSFAFPRSFAVGIPPQATDYPTVEEHMAAAAEYAKREHHVCFTVEITDGIKDSIGRQVEVQVPADDALRFGPQMVRIGEYQLASYRESAQTPPTEGDQMT